VASLKPWENSDPALRCGSLEIAVAPDYLITSVPFSPHFFYNSERPAKAEPWRTLSLASLLKKSRPTFSRPELRAIHINFLSRLTRAFSVSKFFFLATVSQRRKISQKEKLQRSEEPKEKTPGYAG
jgi:hypothetical protein